VFSRFIFLHFCWFLKGRKKSTPTLAEGVGFGDGEAIEATTGRVFHGPTQVTILGA